MLIYSSRLACIEFIHRKMAFYAMRSGYGKKDEEATANILEKLDKTTILQEARVFNETPVNVRKCSFILTKILCLVNQGETLTTKEATQLFFAITQLFQSKKESLRRLVYVCIKELCRMAEDVIIVTSSLQRDMTGKDDVFRGAAIRALCRIAENEPAIIQSIERYMKQAIVDKSPAVASAALVSSLHLLLSGNHDVVRRWGNEVQEAVNADSSMVQYHALGLLYHIKRTDRLAVSKLVSRFATTRGGSFLRSPLAMCLLIRIACRVVYEEKGKTDIEKSLVEFLESCVRHKNEMVVYEAAYALVSLRQYGIGTNADMISAIAVLQLFCSSPKPTMRYTAVRTLSQIANTQPAPVAACTIDLENLISDSNRSIATLAITTLLKVGTEASVERLMKQISSFMSEISDEFKIVVVEAVKLMCMKYPRKHLVMMNYLSTMLRDEGGYEYKKAIVDTLITIIEENADAREGGLEQLCEFIEDCEHVNLAVRILSLLGREGAKSPGAPRYIRYIYNRVILETAPVRAAAVTALARFAAVNPQLVPRVLVLLERCTFDEDDEVRDRATFFRTVLSSGKPALINTYIVEGLQFSLPALESALEEYCSKPNANKQERFDINAVPLASVEELAGNLSKTSSAVAKKDRPTPAATEQAAAKRDLAAKEAHGAAGQPSAQQLLTEKLASIPQLQTRLGPLFKSCTPPIELTESETEYVVKCTKHIFRQHIVFQFECTNTLNDHVLENVVVNMRPDAANDVSAGHFKLIGTVPCARLVYDKPDSTFSVIQIVPVHGADAADAEHVADQVADAVGTLQCTMKFRIKECDPAGDTSAAAVDDGNEGYEDDYSLETVEVTLADYMQKVAVADFDLAWQQLAEAHEEQGIFALSAMNSIKQAVANITDFFGMQPCDRTDRIDDDTKTTHTLLMSGVYCGNHRVLAHVKFIKGTSEPGGAGVTVNLQLRSDSAALVEMLIGSM